MILADRAQLPGRRVAVAGGELGVSLQDAQNIRSVAAFPWLIIPALFVVVTVLAFNFVGDGLRDAADSLQVTPVRLRAPNRQAARALIAWPHRD